MKKGLQKFAQSLISLVLLLKYRLHQNCNALLSGFALPYGISAIAKGLKSFVDGDFVTGNKTHTKHLQPLFIKSCYTYNYEHEKFIYPGNGNVALLDDV